MDADLLGRTVKLELDEGRADSPDAAKALVATYRVGITAGAGFERSRTATAAVMTALATAKRAFPGGVWLAAAGDPILAFGWGRGRRLSEVASELGASLVLSLPVALLCVIAIGDPPAARPALHATWQGWAGGVVLSGAERALEDDIQPLTGVLSAGLAVSEAFQWIRGFVLAGRRSVGMSLWRPDLPWRDEGARGPRLALLPEKSWLLGLGHLGQAFAWSIGWLPFERPDAVLVGLIDPQRIVPANVDTGLLTASVDAGQPKARIVAAALASLRIQSRVVERRFDERFRPVGDEPILAFAGFDNPTPRRLLEDIGFVRSIDVGLGSGRQYLDGLVHAFPSGVRAREAFPRIDAPPATESPLLEQPAYRAEIERLEAAGLSTEAARCGAVEVAGRTVGAAFVGAVASTLGLAEELRALVDGPRFEVLSFSLRSGSIEAVVNQAPGPRRNPGYLSVAVG